MSGEKDYHKSRATHTWGGVKVTGQLWEREAGPLKRPPTAHLAEHPFLLTLRHLLADPQSREVRLKIIKNRVHKRHDRGRPNEKTDAESALLRAEYGDDVLAGNTFSGVQLQRLASGFLMPRVDQQGDVDQVLQIAREFGLKDDQRAALLADGYDYVEKCRQACAGDLPPPVKVEPPPTPVVSRLKRDVSNLMLPAFFEQTVFPTRGMRDGRIYVLTPGQKQPHREKLSFSKLRGELGVPLTIIEFITGKDLEPLKPFLQKRREEEVAELMGKLLIKPEDELCQRAMEAVKHDIALRNRSAPELAGPDDGRGR